MAEMFAKDVYIESANMEPEHYNIRLKGKGCMLLAGQLTRMFYDSGGKNFITSTIEYKFSNGKDVFALTIQKMSEGDTPAQKIERQAKRIAELDAEAQELHDRKEEFAKRIAELEKESADYESELIGASKDAGIDMGDGENPQDVITAIGILGKRLQDFRSVAKGLNGDLNRYRPLTEKQHAALKKLGQAKRRRGKALVEARQQLRQEGKL
jgi:predicted RNase H-like nuclease (RuvC/YqgF family)